MNPKLTLEEEHAFCKKHMQLSGDFPLNHNKQTCRIFPNNNHTAAIANALLDSNSNCLPPSHYMQLVKWLFGRPHKFWVSFWFPVLTTSMVPTSKKTLRNRSTMLKPFGTTQTGSGGLRDTARIVLKVCLWTLLRTRRGRMFKGDPGQRHSAWYQGKPCSE